MRGTEFAYWLTSDVALEWSTQVHRMKVCKTTLFAAAVVAFFAVAMLRAQAPATRPSPRHRAPPAPAVQPAPPAQTSPSGHPNNSYWMDHDKQLLVDFGGLEHFKEANANAGCADTGRGPRGLHGRLDYRRAGSWMSRFPASPTSTAASAGRRLRRCWSGSGRTCSI